MRIKSDNHFLFSQKNYLCMGIGLALIAIGFFLMTGTDANTRPDGTYDPHYWNEDIFSWTRIRLAPFLVLLGFGVEVFAILWSPENKTITE
ncbi:MAG: DUF3098 domain-containing protein [Weeksellaceae bacterium]